MQEQANPAPQVLTAVPPSHFEFQEVSLSKSDTLEKNIERAIKYMKKNSVSCALFWIRPPKKTDVNVLSNSTCNKSRTQSPSGVRIIYSKAIRKDGLQIEEDYILKPVEQNTDFIFVRMYKESVFTRS
jgi:hypothetical protein